MVDNVNHPKHYENLAVNISFRVQPINLYSCYDFCMGAAIQYILRAPYKYDEIEDYRKAIWYLRYLKHSFIVPCSGINDEIVYLKALEIYKKQNPFINVLLNKNGTCNYKNRIFTIKKLKQKIKELQALNEEVTEVPELIKEQDDQQEVTND